MRKPAGGSEAYWKWRWEFMKRNWTRWRKFLLAGRQSGMTYYPACPEPERARGHDAACATPRDHPVDGVRQRAGLQVLRKDNRWVTAPPVPGTIVVNLGQIMVEVYSNGTYRAPDHRVVVNKEKERVSIATFCNPSPSLPAGPSQLPQPPGSPYLPNPLQL
ncbi:protein SRG1-like [Eucalyptus grandis]|uniref:protein SRG1-like n=1 Tax=Eucalyptus grandis TaxID=71139 RepID=UPI00192E7BC2|nr:protein SRG1-like [Eucalyptus grandis]